MNQIQIKYLIELSKRLNSKGFSWNHQDYFLLKEIVPEMVRHLSVIGHIEVEV